MTEKIYQPCKQQLKKLHLNGPHMILCTLTSYSYILKNN